MKASRLRKKGKVPAQDSWNADITICNMLAGHLEWHLKWTKQQHELFPPREDKKYLAEMERAYKALSSYQEVFYDVTKPASKQQLMEVQWAIHWVARNIRGLWH